MNDEGKAAASAGGAVGLSALASFIGLCCIGPWSAALFGVSGAIALARWQTYRPHILIVAGLPLARAFWRVYRSPAACDSGPCAKPRSIPLQLALGVAPVDRQSTRLTSTH